jgi:DeoR/GlpR family transcriptional regulator of sugar metabolism
MSKLVNGPRVLDAERRQQIVAFVDEHHGATVADLSERFGISEATVRRDLILLSRRGLIERAHGGAIPRRTRDARVFPEPPILDRATLMTEEKERIGRAAAVYVEDGDTIMIAGGTTTAHMIPHLAERTGVTVVTNNLNVASLLTPLSHLTVILIGGVLRHSELSLLGALAEDALDNLRVDKLFIGSSAIDIDFGLSADDLAEAQIDRALMAAAREITVLADHTKLDRIRTIRVIPLERVSRLVTDRGISEDQREALERLGIALDVV